MRIQVLHRDDDLVAVAKPVGMLTHADKAEPDGEDVLSVLKAQLGLSYLGVHHRLDRETSGVLVFAIRKEGNASLARNLEGRLAKKEYVAVIHGRPAKLDGHINVPLVAAGSGAWRPASPRDRDAKKASTRYRVERVGPRNAYCFVRLWPATGRTHQLRVHLAHLGCPIIGDVMYGPAGDGFPRLLLHAEALTLVDIDDSELELRAPFPSLFDRAARGEKLPELAVAARLARAGALELAEADGTGLDGLLALAAERRLPLSEDPSATLLRLVNGAGDGLPGLTLDRYGPVLRLEISAPVGDAGQPVVDRLLDAVSSRWPGMPVRVQAPDRAWWAGGSQTPPSSEVLASEEGRSLSIRPTDEHQPGPAPALRGLRTRVARWAEGGSVLDCSSHRGGFCAVALASGARVAVHAFPDVAVRLAAEGQAFDLVVAELTLLEGSAGTEMHAVLEQLGRAVRSKGRLLVWADVPGWPAKRIRAAVEAAFRPASRAFRELGAFHESDLDHPRAAGVEPRLNALAFELDPA